jgi:Fic family protein
MNKLLLITKLKGKLDLLYPNKDKLEVVLKKIFWVDLIYVSSVVEGIDLTRAQVEDIVKNEAKSKLLKTSDENLLQAYGQLLVLKKIESWAKQKKPITTNCLLEIHQLAFGKIDPQAGNYRKGYVKLRSSALLPSFPFVIAADMRDFNSWLQHTQKKLDKNDLEGVIHLIAYSYHQVTKIHPFSDGNGRSARLFVNLLLRRYNLPYIVIPKVDNFVVMRKALRAADMGDLSLMIKYMEQFILESLELTLKN